MRLKFPMAKIDELILRALSLNGLFVTFFFLVAKPVVGLDLHGGPLPTSWEAAVPNHGGYFQWYLIATHPALFVAGLLLFLVPTYVLYKARGHNDLQVESPEASPKTRTITRVFGIAAFVLIGAWWALHVVATIYPA